jgi:hypothetical protein
MWPALRKVWRPLVYIVDSEMAARLSALRAGRTLSPFFFFVNWINSMTSSVIEPSTFRLISWCLNQLRYRMTLLHLNNSNFHFLAIPQQRNSLSLAGNRHFEFVSCTFQQRHYQPGNRNKYFQRFFRTMQPIPDVSKTSYLRKFEMWWIIYSRPVQFHMLHIKGVLSIMQTQTGL